MRRRSSVETFLIGKSALLREGIARLLGATNFRISASVSCADDLPSESDSNQLLFLIVHTGDDFNAALEQIKHLRETYREGRIAIVADHYRCDKLVSAFQAGANGYFFDITTCDVFIKSIELVMMGETIFPPAFLSFALDPKRDQIDKAAPPDKNERVSFRIGETMAPQLSAREKSILQCLIEGSSNKCIALKIDIAEATVKVHVKAILRKIRVQNRTQAAIWAINHRSPEGPKNVYPLPSAGVMNRRLADSPADTSEIKSMRPPDPLESMDPQPDHIEMPDIDRLIPKSSNRRANGAARFDK